MRQILGGSVNSNACSTSCLTFLPCLTAGARRHVGSTSLTAAVNSGPGDLRALNVRMSMRPVSSTTYCAHTSPLTRELLRAAGERGLTLVRTAAGLFYLSSEKE